MFCQRTFAVPGNVNFCREIVPETKNRDVITAVLGGIPTDVLI